MSNDIVLRVLSVKGKSPNLLSREGGFFRDCGLTRTKLNFYKAFWTTPLREIRLLKILTFLGSGNKSASEQMYAVMGDIFRKCDSASNIGNAIIYEIIYCIASIHPNPKLLEAAAEVIARFLKVVGFATFFNHQWPCTH